MSETGKQRGAELEAPGGHDAFVAFPDDLFSHLHFDRQARAWRSPAEVVPEAVGAAEENAHPQLRSA